MYRASKRSLRLLGRCWRDGSELAGSIIPCSLLRKISPRGSVMEKRNFLAKVDPLRSILSFIIPYEIVSGRSCLPLLVFLLHHCNQLSSYCVFLAPYLLPRLL